MVITPVDTTFETALPEIEPNKLDAVTAIFEESAVPEQWKSYTPKNAQFFLDHPGISPAQGKGK